MRYENIYFIKTGIKSLDKLGGLLSNSIIEICGAPGSGKTRLLHQIASLSLAHSIVNDIIFVDADLTFQPMLIDNMLRNIGITESKVFLKHIHVIRTPSSPQSMIDTIKLFLSKFDTEHQNRKVLIIIDSITNLITADDISKIHSDTLTLGLALRQLSRQASIIVNNQTRDLLKVGLGGFQLYDAFWYVEKKVPALGKIWSYFIDSRLYLKKIRRDMGILVVIFSNFLPEIFFSFKYGDVLLQ